MIPAGLLVLLGAQVLRARQPGPTGLASPTATSLLVLVSGPSPTVTCWDAAPFALGDERKAEGERRRETHINNGCPQLSQRKGTQSPTSLTETRTSAPWGPLARGHCKLRVPPAPGLSVLERDRGTRTLQLQASS